MITTGIGICQGVKQKNFAGGPSVSETLGTCQLELRARPIIFIPAIRRAVFAIESRTSKDHWEVISYCRVDDHGQLEEIDLDD
jgi:hypothetical protein